MVVNFRGYQGSEQDTVSTANKNIKSLCGIAASTPLRNYDVSSFKQTPGVFLMGKPPSIFMAYGIFTRLISHNHMVDEICHIFTANPAGSPRQTAMLSRLLCFFKDPWQQQKEARNGPARSRL